LTGREIRTITRQIGCRSIPVKRALALLRIFRDIDQYRTWSSRFGDVKSFTQSSRDILGPSDKVVMLGDWQRDAGDVDFLKGIAADEPAANLTRNADYRRGTEHRCRDAGDHIRCPRPRGGNRDAALAAGSCETIRHMRRALLVAHQNVLNGRLSKRVIDRKH